MEIILNENSGQFTLGTGDTRFDLYLQYPYGDKPTPGAPKVVRHYSDNIGRIGLVVKAAERVDMLADLPAVLMSNRTEETSPGDMLVMLNRAGFWALLLLDDVRFEDGPNGHEPVALMRYAIATDRSPLLTFEDIPPIQPYTACLDG